MELVVDMNTQKHTTGVVFNTTVLVLNKSNTYIGVYIGRCPWKTIKDNTTGVGLFFQDGLKTDIFTQSGVFSLRMGIPQKVIGWSYTNLKEIRSWGVIKYFLVYSKKLSHVEIFFEYFWIFSIQHWLLWGPYLVWCTPRGSSKLYSASYGGWFTTGAASI